MANCDEVSYISRFIQGKREGGLKNSKCECSRTLILFLKGRTEKTRQGLSKLEAAGEKASLAPMEAVLSRGNGSTL
jgi:hypothetical protein